MNDNRPKIKVAVTTTISPVSKPIVPNWLNWVDTVLKTQCPNNISIEKSVVCASSNFNDNWLIQNIGCSNKKYWCKKKPGLRGAGEIWRQACVFCFEPCECGQPNIKVDYVLHTPRDVDYDNPQSSDDIQNHIHEIFDDFKTDKESDYPDLVIGDYETPDTIDGLIKRKIEEAVIEQLKYYDLYTKLDNNDPLKRPRSEFFLISEKLFNDVEELWKEYPKDPMPIVLDYAIRNGYKVEKKYIGIFHQTGKYNIKVISNQIFRTAAQISLYGLKQKYEPHKSLKEEDENKLLEGMEKADKKWKEILSILINKKIDDGIEETTSMEILANGDYRNIKESIKKHINKYLSPW